MAEETGLKLTLNPEDRFSRDVAQLVSMHTVYLSSLNNIRNWIGEHTEYLITGYLSTLDS